ncbi:MAG: UDP-glucose 4-epimerase GalE [Chloroflexi bacterium]|nr:UDP-glucose 4-epimerase GalE [Chloroflexota bacterium]
MRVLVTGGAGYIGSFAVRALQEAGHEVVVYDNLSYGHRQAVRASLEVADLADSSALDGCLRQGFDAVMHFAAFIEAGESMVDAARFFANNTANSITLLNACVRHGVRRVVFSSSAAVYQDGLPVPIKEIDPTIPANVYGETKLLVERMLPWYDRVHGLRSVSLRYFNATGAALDGSMGQDHEPATHLITVAIKAALGQQTPFVLFGDDYPTPDGTCIRDYIHVVDLAAAHVLALDHLSSGGPSDVFNVGAGTGHSNREVVKTVKRVSGVDFPVEIGPRRAGDPAELVADSTKIQSLLGWKPEYSDLDTIVSSAWEWHRTHPHGYR